MEECYFKVGVSAQYVWPCKCGLRLLFITVLPSRKSDRDISKSDFYQTMFPPKVRPKAGPNSLFQHKIHNKLILVILTQIHGSDWVHFHRLNPVQWYLLVIRWLGNMLASGGHRLSWSLSEQSKIVDWYIYVLKGGGTRVPHPKWTLSRVLSDSGHQSAVANYGIGWWTNQTTVGLSSTQWVKCNS